MMGGRPVVVLDLCAGTGSIGKSMRHIFRGRDVTYISVDNEVRHKPTFVADVRTWDWKRDLAKHFDGRVPRFDIVWASPPCTEYSLAKSIGRRNFRLADSIVKACWNIIAELAPERWYMENPSTGYLKTRPFMARYAAYMHFCSYCRYGRDFKKPTNIWTNVDCELKECTRETPCKHKRLTNTHPVASQHSANYQSDTGLNSGIARFKAYQIPHGLLKELFSAPPSETLPPVPPAQTKRGARAARATG